VQLAGILHSNKKLSTSHCQTGSSCKGECLLGLVLFNAVINDLDNRIQNILSGTAIGKKWEQLKKNPPKNFKEHYGN